MTETGARVVSRFERSAAFWLRAYPRRWRVARGAEVTAVLTDLAPAGATRLDLRSALGLLRGGWATRWRERPPVRVLIGYRWFQTVPPGRYRAWVRDDIEGPLFPARDMAWRMSPLVAIYLLGAVNGTYPAAFLIGYLLLLVAIGGFASTRSRRTAAGRALRAAPDDAVGQWGLLSVSTLRDRWLARPVLRSSTALLAVGATGWGLASLRVAAEAPACATGTGACPRGLPVQPLAMGLLLVAVFLAGAWCALLAVGRLQRELPRRPAQPSRRVVRPAPGLAVGAAAAATVVVGEAWLEGSGQWPTVVAPVAGPLCLLLLVPVAAATWLVRDRSDVAIVDVRRIAVTGRAPVIDSLVEGLVEAYRVARPDTVEADDSARGADEPQWILGIAR